MWCFYRLRKIIGYMNIVLDIFMILIRILSFMILKIDFWELKIIFNYKIIKILVVSFLFEFVIYESLL